MRSPLHTKALNRNYQNFGLFFISSQNSQIVATTATKEYQRRSAIPRKFIGESDFHGIVIISLFYIKK